MNTEIPADWLAASVLIDHAEKQFGSLSVSLYNKQSRDIVKEIMNLAIPKSAFVIKHRHIWGVGDEWFINRYNIKGPSTGGYFEWTEPDEAYKASVYPGEIKLLAYKSSRQLRIPIFKIIHAQKVVSMEDFRCLIGNPSFQYEEDASCLDERQRIATIAIEKREPTHEELMAWRKNKLKKG